MLLWNSNILLPFCKGKTVTEQQILKIVDRTTLFPRLLNYSICLVPRGIRHPPSSNIFPTVCKDKHGTGTASIQACSALLAKGGVCFIGELSSYKKDKLELLQSGNLSIDAKCLFTNVRELAV